MLGYITLIRCNIVNTEHSNYTEQKYKNVTYNNFKDFTELQSNEINSLGPNLWISHDWEYRYVSVGYRYLKK